MKFQSILLCSGDGIYSLTLTDYPAVGRYKFSISADDNDMQSHVTRTWHDETPSSHYDTAHDNVPGRESSMLHLSRFSRTVPGPIVHVSTLPTIDVIPPATITDLNIALVDNMVSSNIFGVPMFKYFLRQIRTNCQSVLRLQKVKTNIPLIGLL